MQAEPCPFGQKFSLILQNKKKLYCENVEIYNWLFWCQFFFLEYFHVSHETTFCEKKTLIYLSKNTTENEH